jgi:hypothetical protein
MMQNVLVSDMGPSGTVGGTDNPVRAGSRLP